MFARLVPRVGATLFRVLPARGALVLQPVHIRSFGVMDRLRETIGKQKDKKMNEKRRM
jgi:hypothetical protein